MKDDRIASVTIELIPGGVKEVSHDEITIFRRGIGRVLVSS
jgi:hypothetical protein